MERNVLLVLGNGYNRKNLIDSAIYLRDNFGFRIRPFHVRDVRKKEDNFGFRIRPFHVRDVRKKEFLPNAVDGIMLEPMLAGINKEWNAFEEKEIEKIKAELKENGIDAELEVSFGITPEVVIQELKKSDMLLIEKEERFTEDLIVLMKRFYKPIIVVRDKPLRLEKIAIANDDGTKVNKSFQRFANIFTHIKEIKSFELVDSLEVDDEEENKENYLNAFMEGKGLKVESVKLLKSDSDAFLQICKEEDVLIMGNLSNSYLYEKLTKRVGIKIMEQAETTLFIA